VRKTSVIQRSKTDGKPPKRLRPVWANRTLASSILLAALIFGVAYLAIRPGGPDVDRSASTDAQEKDFSRVDAFVEAEMDAQRIPGLAVAIVRDDRIVHMRGFGMADPSGRAVTPQTPFVIGSVSKSFTATAIMQLVSVGKVELDAPVQRYLPWFRVADEQASGEITVRHLLNHTSGLSTKTGRSFQGRRDTSEGALERAVRDLRTVTLTTSVGEAHQYSTINYSVLGLIVQTVSEESYESYIHEHIFDALEMRHSFTSPRDAELQGLAAGHRYWLGRPMTADEPNNRGLLPAGYLISSAEDLGHYVAAQLNQGTHDGGTLLSPADTAELHHAAVPTAETETSYGMGWFVGPVNGMPAVFHQGETFSYHANIVMLPGSHQGVVVLMNAENSQDLFFRGRMGTVAAGIASLVQGEAPPAPPSSVGLFVVYAAVLGAIGIQVAGMIRSAVCLRHRRVPSGRFELKTRTGVALASNLTWGLLVLVLLPKQLGAPLLTLAQGLPDLAYALLASGVVAVVWSVARTGWTYFAFDVSSRRWLAAPLVP
jgi:CubicO group peptidase (beta-lactamase class C family)